ncbi:hypothetical protein [Laspinema olomoucense]|uniref:hypothetical protein n=1 Tax=Laspinema olomoucense TaxID=3231600 RepID=UPI0021BB70A0|nr:hypothetical protein [Laspinema sp. D3a]MCT7991817.1 hypothetical protein [Laspinema sp. D3a]
MASAAQCNQVLGPVVLRDTVVVMHVEREFAPFRFSQVVRWVIGTQALAVTFGATPVCLLFDH